MKNYIIIFLALIGLSYTSYSDVVVSSSTPNFGLISGGGEFEKVWICENTGLAPVEFTLSVTTSSRTPQDWQNELDNQTFELAAGSKQNCGIKITAGNSFGVADYTVTIETNTGFKREVKMAIASIEIMDYEITPDMSANAQIIGDVISTIAKTTVQRISISDFLNFAPLFTEKRNLYFTMGEDATFDMETFSAFNTVSEYNTIIVTGTKWLLPVYNLVGDLFFLARGVDFNQNYTNRDFGPDNDFSIVGVNSMEGYNNSECRLISQSGTTSNISYVKLLPNYNVEPLLYLQSEESGELIGANFGTNDKPVLLFSLNPYVVPQWDFEQFLRSIATIIYGPLSVEDNLQFDSKLFDYKILSSVGSDIKTVQIEAQNINIQEVALFSMTGSKLESIERNNFENMNNVSINLQSGKYANGAYFLLVVTDKGFKTIPLIF